MRNIIKYFIFTYILTFIFIFDVRAECSYQERKDLLNNAKKTEIFFTVETENREFVGINPNTDLEETFMKEYNYFNLNISGLSNDLFIKIINNKNDDEIIVNYEDLVNDIYTIKIDNTTDIIKYYVFFYSLNDNCFAEDIHQKTVIKPKENSVYYYSVCSNELVSENQYCKQFIEKDFNLNEYEIVNKLNEIIDDNEQIEKNSIIEKVQDFISNYWHYMTAGIVIIIIIVIVLIIRKKRSEL